MPLHHSHAIPIFLTFFPSWNDNHRPQDCLFLNIFTPKKANYSSIGVRVVFHGGWFYRGSISDPYLNGCDSVAETNTTLVVVQVRRFPVQLSPSTWANRFPSASYNLHMKVCVQRMLNVI